MPDPIFGHAVQMDTLSAEDRERLRDQLYTFRLCGGTVSLAEFLDLRPQTREALVEASRAFEEARARLLAVSILREQSRPTSPEAVAAARAADPVSFAAGEGGA